MPTAVASEDNYFERQLRHVRTRRHSFNPYAECGEKPKCQKKKKENKYGSSRWILWTQVRLTAESRGNLDPGVRLAVSPWTRKAEHIVKPRTAHQHLREIGSRRGLFTHHKRLAVTQSGQSITFPVVVKSSIHVVIMCVFDTHAPGFVSVLFDTLCPDILIVYKYVSGINYLCAYEYVRVIRSGRYSYCVLRTFV